MEQNTLYRKYRPIDFDTVVGQDAIVTTLKNQIINDKVSHAYLFCGTRGTGKTTVAKIFARALNCENKKADDANPCNECETCKSILQNKDININELDAAANNGIDDIRNIIELTQYPPTNNERYKVFIIDEAHELSDKARDAFLKTLEEPPSYVVFILCTTEPYKFKQTILSRCQRYDFKRISVDNIVDYLKQISKKENITITDEALYFIAQRADGSMRESLSLLDRVQAFNKDNIDLKISQETLGISDEHYFKELTISLIKEDAKECITIIGSLINEGKEIAQFVNDYIWYLRNIMLAKNMDKPNELLTITQEKFDEMKELSDKLSVNTILWYIDKLSETANVMKQDENKRVQIETCFIRMCMPQGDYSKEGLINRIDILENKLNEKSFYRVFDTKIDNTINDDAKINGTKKIEPQLIQQKQSQEQVIEKTTNHIETQTDDIANKVKNAWKEIVSDLHRSHKFLEECTLRQSEKTGMIDIVTTNSFVDSLFNNKEYLTKIKDKTKSITGIDVDFSIILVDENKKTNDRISKINENLNKKGLMIIQED